MKETLVSVYKDLFLNESINIEPASLSPNERTLRNVYGKRYQEDKPGKRRLRNQSNIPSGKGIEDSLYRIERCIEYLKDSGPSKIKFGFKGAKSVNNVEIVLSDKQERDLLTLYRRMSNRYKGRDQQSSSHRARTAARLNNARVDFTRSYKALLLEIYLSKKSDIFRWGDLSYVTFVGKDFEKHVKPSIRYEVNTVNNAVSIFRNIQHMYRSMIISLHNTVKEVYSDPSIFYSKVHSNINKDKLSHHQRNIDLAYLFLIQNGQNNILNRFNKHFKKYLDKSKFDTDTMSGFNPSEELQAEKALKTAISFLIIDLGKASSYVGIVKNLEGTPSPDNIEPRDVSDASLQRSDLEFKLPHFSIKQDPSDNTQQAKIEEQGRSLEIELKDGIARAGSGTFWIAFEQKVHDDYTNNISADSSIIAPHSRYIFKGTQSKELWPKTDSDSEKYKPIQDKVNEIFRTFDQNVCITLDVVLNNSNSFYKHDDMPYMHDNKNYYLYYMKQQSSPELAKLWNHKEDLSEKNHKWLSTYYHDCKKNEFIDINGKGLYLLADPTTFEKPENKKFGQLCREGRIKNDNNKPIVIPIIPSNDLSNLTISLFGARAGCKFEAYIANLNPSPCKGFESTNQKFIYKFLLLASLVFSRQTDSEVQDDSFYDFILNNSLELFSDVKKIKLSKESFALPNNKLLKEVYSCLFDKKLINEGGLAGHMMHPYEALDMTPRQIIDRIKEYSASQKIIEKVDGQNLFFTVEQDGTLMFARNKEDMTHDDLVAKFTGHGAEKPFVEGGNAIKRGVEQWLQSAGPAAEMEIRESFHPDGEIKSFINFEIMHPDKPNQIIYDEKYIVFHSIVDYVDGRKTIHSTNKGQRLEKIIRLMDSGISSAGFTLASNRTVNLNELTSVQIEDYVERVKEVALSLGINEDVTLGEGIENIIKQEIEGLGIDLDREALKKIYDFVLYGEDRQGNKIKSKDFTSSLIKSDIAGLRSLDLTSASKALKKVQRIISPFKDVFVDLGVDLLKGVKSAYMSDETNQKNIELLRDKLQTAINDLTNYMNEKPENYWEPEVHRLRRHLDKVIDKDITDIVATTVEGGVYDYQGDLIKVTGGFAPLNQILGAAYRDKKGIFPSFREKFIQQESNRRSLKSIFNLIF